MQKLQFLSLSIASAIVFGCIALVPAHSASGDGNASGEVVSQFKPVLGTFRVSRIPVMLPTWVPKGCESKSLQIGSGPDAGGYEYSFGTCNADTLLSGGGIVGKAERSSRHVKLSGGRDACLVEYGNFRGLEWQQGKFCYRVIVPNNPKNDADLIKAANSVVLVPDSVLKVASRGSDPLAQAYRDRNDQDQQSKLSEIGAKYIAGVEAASRKDYAKSERLLRELIENWQRCDQMPPLSQVKLALAQTLTKSGHTSEADQIKKDISEKAKVDEQLLVESVDEQKDKTEKAQKGAVDYNSARTRLAQVRDKLAMFYFAEGRYAEAETLFKAAFNDSASVYGRGASDARLTADHYAMMLRTIGRSEDPAKQLLKPQTSGHKPVVLKLSPDAGFKKLGADEVVLVIEDEYGAPSGEQWFSRKGMLRGMRGGAELWSRPIKFDDAVNMDKCDVTCNGGTFTVNTTLGFAKYTYKFAWDGVKLSKMKTSGKK